VEIKMEVKIMIRTPKGQAKGTEKKFRYFIPIGGIIKETLINDEDSEMIWVIDAPYRKVLEIQKRVNWYSHSVGAVMGNKKFKKLVNEDQKEELEDMLNNQTSIEIIKEATANEIVEANKTWWQRVKEKFKKVET
jgi:hypothetical protein